MDRRGVQTPLTVLALCAATLLGAACGGGDTGGAETEAAQTPATANPGAPAGGTGTGATAGGTAAGGGAVADTSVITAQLIAQGDRVYHGQEGGAICVTCHGQDATGISGLGPNLTDDQWLHGDGSYEFIQNIIRTGVQQPIESPSVMPPYGGVPFSDEHLQAVAAYVYSLSHPNAAG